MKTRTLLFSIILLLALPVLVQAQDCGYYALAKGTTFAYQNLDAKGKLTGSVRTTCQDATRTETGTSYSIKSEYTDDKGNTTTREYNMRCENGNFYIDMQQIVDPKSMESFKNMEVTVNSNDLMYPSQLTAGQVLPDASISISAGSGGIRLMNLLVNVTNRKVESQQSVTVPAGTFDCYKITYDVETKLMFKIYTTVTEYVNMGVGNVKTETYDKKGKLLGTTQLTEVKK